MPRSVWKGAIAFGLVNIPVRVVSAVKSHDVRFRQLHDVDGAPVLQKRVCSLDGEEVPYEHIVKGYEVEPDHYVVVTQEDLDAVAPESTDLIEIQDFVDLQEVDPIHFERSYYLVPQKGAARAYALLNEAMRRTGRAGIGRVVMRSREHLVALRPMGAVLAMTTLLHADEILPVEALEEIPSAAEAEERELDMARRLVEALTTTFHAERYEDEYRERLLSLLESKAQGREIVAPPRARPAPTADLASALEESIQAARRRREAEA